MLGLAVPPGPLKGDRGTCRVRICGLPLDQTGIEDSTPAVGDWVEVRPMRSKVLLGGHVSARDDGCSSKNFSFLCQVWPWQVGDDHVAAPDIPLWCSVDETCVLSPAAGGSANDLDRRESASSVRRRPTSLLFGNSSVPVMVQLTTLPRPVSCVAVRVRVSTDTSGLPLGRDPYNAPMLDSAVSGTSELVLRIKQSLMQMAVVEGCTVQVGFANVTVEILSTVPSRIPVKIGSQTVISLDDTESLLVVPEKTPRTTDQLDGNDHDPSPIWAEIFSVNPVHELAGLRRQFSRLVEVLLVPRLCGATDSVVFPLARGVFVHGPSGCGKKLLLHHAAAATNAILLDISASQILGTAVGQAERVLRRLFSRANAIARENQNRPVVIAVHKLESFQPAGGSGERVPHAARACGQLAALIDDYISGTVDPVQNLFVVGLASSRSGVGATLTRPGRLEREIQVGVPDLKQRVELLSTHSDLPKTSEVLVSLAPQLPGFTGADIRALCREAKLFRLRSVTRRSLKEGDYSSRDLSLDDFKQGRARVRATTQTDPLDLERVTWDDIGGLATVKRRLRQAIEWPLQFGNAFTRLRLRPPRGVLLHGPPGCSKTLLARAAAHQSRATFLSLSGASVFSQWVGDAEAVIRNVFARARLGTPSIIFLDEIEALVGSREAEGAGSQVHERVLTTLLNEMDGIEHCDGVLVLGATNRLDLVDEALLRPGRIDIVLRVPPPDQEGRHEILKIKSRNMPLAHDVDLVEIAAMTEGWTGAELENMCREAALCALRRSLASTEVKMADFSVALSREV